MTMDQNATARAGRQAQPLETGAVAVGFFILFHFIWDSSFNALHASGALHGVRHPHTQLPSQIHDTPTGQGGHYVLCHCLIHRTIYSKQTECQTIPIAPYPWSELDKIWDTAYALKTCASPIVSVWF